jgi:hypothetical protein
MGIFPQNRHFSKVLVDWRARVQTLVVWRAKFYFFLYIYIYITKTKINKIIMLG